MRRREIQERELRKIGRFAEKRALQVLKTRFPGPSHSCLWRNGYLDSEKEEIRKLGIICDIDIWNTETERPEAFYEVKAQLVSFKKGKPTFFLSSAEWRSLKASSENGIPYCIWLVQYETLDNLREGDGKIRILEFQTVEAEWVSPEVLLVVPVAGTWGVIVAG